MDMDTSVALVSNIDECINACILALQGLNPPCHASINQIHLVNNFNQFTHGIIAAFPMMLQKELPKEREMVLTSNGKPIAIISAVSEEDLEGAITTIRRARSIEAVTAMQTQSLETGKDKMGMEEIGEEISAVRKRRKGR